MHNYKNNELVNDGNSIFRLSVLSSIGDRDDQQDSFGYSLKSDEGIIVVCDGMGGHEGGRLASSVAVDLFVSNYEKTYPENNPGDLMQRIAVEADRKISELEDAQGVLLNAGSTAVALIIKDKNLYWCSVGDSRAYLFRKGEFVQFTQDQNYKTVLNERLNAGLIDESEYNKELDKGEALISYLGIGNLSLIDYNSSPLTLEKDDKLIIMTDGLYKLLPNDKMRTILDNFNNEMDAARALEQKANKAASDSKKSRDNITFAIIKII